MYLYHVTPSSNANGIARFGILRAKSRASGRIYAVSAQMLPWAIDHVVARHGCETVSVIKFLKRGKWFKQSQYVHYTFHDVSPSLFYAHRGR